MNTLKHILVNVGEEATEVAKEALKAVRYSIHSRNSISDPEKTKNHGENLVEEFYQLAGLIEHLQDKNLLPMFTQAEITEIKSAKINRMYENIQFCQEE